MAVLDAQYHQVVGKGQRVSSFPGVCIRTSCHYVSGRAEEQGGKLKNEGGRR